MSLRFLHRVNTLYERLTGHALRARRNPSRLDRAARRPRLESLEERLEMATWVTPTSANFLTAARWNTGRVPGSGEAADILVAGSPYTVTIDRNTTVSSLTINSTAATVNHAGAVFSLANSKTVNLLNGKLNIGSLATFRIDQGATFNFNGGTLSGNVLITNGGTVRQSGTAQANNARLLFDGNGTYSSPQVAPGQTLQVDGPITSNVNARLTIPQSSIANNGRIELTNARNTGVETRLQFNAGVANNNGVLQNRAGGVLFLDNPGVKHIFGRLDNQGLIDFGAVNQRLSVDFGFSNLNGTLKMKWTDPNVSDVIDVRGTVNLSGALQLNASPNIPVGRNTVIIRNDGTDAILGTFTNVSEGSILAFNGLQFRISYRGGEGGNDVTLTRVNTPAQFPDRTLANPRGNLAVLSGVVTDPDPGAIFHLSVNWGDGTPTRTHVYRNRSGQRVSLTHRYAAPGEYNVSLSWVDQFGEGRSAVMTARVGLG